MKFALDVEREIYRTQSTSMIDQPDNIVFSPISLSVTLAIVLAGSAGRTFDEVSRVLGLEAGVDISRNSEVVHQMFGMLLNQLHNEITGSPGPRINFATAAFVQVKLSVKWRNIGRYSCKVLWKHPKIWKFSKCPQNVIYVMNWNHNHDCDNYNDTRYEEWHPKVYL